MSSGNLDQAGDALTGAFHAADARELGSIIESLPELTRVLHEGLVTLDGEVTERAGPALEQTGAAIAALAQHAAALAEAAQEAASSWLEESGWWMAGGEI
jgi:hypothetical protein